MEQTRTASQSMNPFRLPNTVIPTRYDLRLEPDLTPIRLQEEKPSPYR